MKMKNGQLKFYIIAKTLTINDIINFARYEEVSDHLKQYTRSLSTSTSISIIVNLETMIERYPEFRGAILNEFFINPPTIFSRHLTRIKTMLKLNENEYTILLSLCLETNGYDRYFEKEFLKSNKQKLIIAMAETHILTINSTSEMSYQFIKYLCIIQSNKVLRAKHHDMKRFFEIIYDYIHFFERLTESEQSAIRTFAHTQMVLSKLTN